MPAKKKAKKGLPPWLKGTKADTGEPDMPGMAPPFAKKGAKKKKAAKKGKSKK